MEIRGSGVKHLLLREIFWCHFFFDEKRLTFNRTNHKALDKVFLNEGINCQSRS
jgi:hypothetical protein